MAKNLRPKPTEATMWGSIQVSRMRASTKKNRWKKSSPKQIERRLARRQRLRFWAGLLLGAAFLGTLGTWGGWRVWHWALESPFFALNKIEVEGNERVVEEELLRLAGLREGENLFQLDEAKAQQAVLTHPWIKSATLEKRYPKTLRIRLTEYREVAILALGDLYLLDEEGKPFKRIQPSEQINLPLVTGLDKEAFIDKPEQSQGELRTALAALRAYKAENKGVQGLWEIRMEGREAILLMGLGQEVLLGEGGFEKKVRRLKRIQEELERRQIVAQVIRLNNRVRPEKVTIQIAKAAPEKEGTR
ncbi:MAG: FtsQ-type POTRA domain-containing protein [Cystobacterineae bacterium]|nr:FtsQ-type POTRA domain-containing protein [Cystobacterineae bacterium]